MIIAVLIRRPDPVSHWKVAFFGGRKQKQCYSTEMTWYFPVLHRPCVGLTAAPPEEMQWFCSKCANKRKDKKHKKRKHRAHWRIGRGLKSCSHCGTSCPGSAAGGIHPARVPPQLPGLCLCSESGARRCPWSGALGFPRLSEPRALDFGTFWCCFFAPAKGNLHRALWRLRWFLGRSRSCGSAATQMNVVNTDICPILSRFVINPSWTFEVRCWEEEKM